MASARDPQAEVDFLLVAHEAQGSLAMAKSTSSGDAS
jgi:hypothetical protein